MKKYSTLLFILLSVLSYSQNIGDQFNSKGMSGIEYGEFYTYTYESKDSIAEISVSRDGKIIAMDYYISRELVSKTGLEWLPKTQIGNNIYYNGDYIFILPKKDCFLIQIRNVEKLL